VSRIRSRAGWLLYEGHLGVIAAEVLTADIEMRTSSLDVTSIMSPVRQLIYGPPDITFTAQLTENLDWDKTGTPGERPHMGALLALARNHPDEYREWCEAEAVLKALGR
jgi:hypothetical protein